MPANRWLIITPRSCQCPECHWTEYSTEAYEYADVTALLVQFWACQDQAYIPKSALDAPLRPVAQPNGRQDSKIDCANPQCYVKSNQTHTLTMTKSVDCDCIVTIV
jgi:hypothetical protein